MIQHLYSLTLALLLAGSIAAALTSRRSDRAGLWVAFGTTLAACGAGLAASVLFLFSGETELLFGGRWTLPVGSFRWGVDGLSAFFLVCLFLVAALTSVYAAGYLLGGQKGGGTQGGVTRTGGPRRAMHAALLSGLIAAIALVVLARDGILFLMAWELMFLTSYILVTQEHERRDVRRAGLVYLVASQIGVVFLFLLFALLARRTGAMDFQSFAAAGAPPARDAALLFALALFGFGLKAGIWPLHIWSPEVYPFAPGHVAGLMSGVMSKVGIYGLLRTLTFLGEPAPWWGLLLVGLGVASAVGGLFYALAQRDLKRLLAYSSVENIGIITAGIGLGLLGLALDAPAVAYLAFTGALWHVLNHGLMKGLLFQGAGSVALGTGTRDMAALGGLVRRMPWTAVAFAAGAAAIAALPPMNAFASKWLLYLGALQGAFQFQGALAAAVVAFLPAFALVGGLAVATFVKAFGVVFLGTGRTNAVDTARDPHLFMRAAMACGALGCLAIGLWPSGALSLVEAPVALLARGAELPDASNPASSALAPFGDLFVLGAVLVALCALLVAVRGRLLKGREVRSTVTWGCGYEAPSPRMQYTPASFSKLLLDAFGLVFTKRRRERAPAGYFPAGARHLEHLGDVAAERIVVPSVRRALDSLGFVRFIQSGDMQHYLAYILVALVLLLVWQL